MGNLILSKQKNLNYKICIICYELSNEPQIINCVNVNNNNLTCPNNDYNYICINCSQEWLIKNGMSCPICRNNNIIINEIKDDSDIYDLLLHEEYYIMCPIFTSVFILMISFCKSFVNWCKNYDSLTKYILNSDKSHNTKRTLLNNILMILKLNSNLSFSDYVKYDIARKQIKIS